MKFIPAFVSAGMRGMVSLCVSICGNGGGEVGRGSWKGKGGGRLCGRTIALLCVAVSFFGPD